MISLGYVSSIVFWLAVVNITRPSGISLIIASTPGKVPVCMRAKGNVRTEDDCVYELCLYPFNPFMGNANRMCQSTLAVQPLPPGSRHSCLRYTTFTVGFSIWPHVLNGRTDGKLAKMGIVQLANIPFHFGITGLGMY